MNTIDIHTLTLTLESKKVSLDQKQKAIIDLLNNALLNNDLSNAKKHFDNAEEVCWYRGLVGDFLGRVSNSDKPTIVTDVRFLDKLITHLTPREYEELVLITGVVIGNTRILNSVINIQLEQQSIAYARSSERSTRDALIEMIEDGYELLAIAHSQPGRGAGASVPSSVDLNYLESIQKNGSNAIGIIVTRDKHVRFYSSIKQFNVNIKGKGIKQIEEYVYKIESSKDNQSKAANIIQKIFKR